MYMYIYIYMCMCKKTFIYSTTMYTPVLFFLCLCVCVSIFPLPPWDSPHLLKPKKKGLWLNWLVVSTHLKNMLVKMGSSSPNFGVKIPKISELPPPSQPKAGQNEPFSSLLSSSGFWPLMHRHLTGFRVSGCIGGMQGVETD